MHVDAATLIQKRQEAIRKIKPYLQQRMLNKLDEKAPWTYINVPESKTKDEVITSIANFINTKLDDFIQLCMDTLPYFTQRDNECIGQDNLSRLAKNFIKLFEFLEDNGFPGAKDFNKPINFWSGKYGKLKALVTTGEISDNKIPSIAAMFDVYSSIKKVDATCFDEALLTSAISRVYASYAKDYANVYVSSDKLSETAGLTVSNNFWLAELPTLMALKHRGIIHDICIHLYDKDKNMWKQPISLFSNEANELTIRRRHYHPFDNYEDKDCFLTPVVTEVSKDIFCHSKPRPYITYGALKRIAHEWRQRARQHKLERAIPPHSLGSKNITR